MKKYRQKMVFSSECPIEIRQKFPPVLTIIFGVTSNLLKNGILRVWQVWHMY
jgi:hypothetical protein